MLYSGSGVMKHGHFFGLRSPRSSYNIENVTRLNIAISQNLPNPLITTKSSCDRSSDGVEGISATVYNRHPTVILIGGREG